MSLTRQEVFQALADGKEIEFKHKSPKVSAWCAIDNYFNCLNAASFPTREWRIKPESLKWYEKIPKHGVLCWVSAIPNDPMIENDTICIILKYVEDALNPFYSNFGQYWKYAIPLTDEEIKQFLRGEDDAE